MNALNAGFGFRIIDRGKTLSLRLGEHINDARVEYVLPFADRTKAEMVARLWELGLEELACKSSSCILHPLRRRGWQQGGHCPACVYRRQAMITAGIREPNDAYAVDLFSPPDPRCPIPAKQLRPISRLPASRTSMTAGRRLASVGTCRRPTQSPRSTNGHRTSRCTAVTDGSGSR